VAEWLVCEGCGYKYRPTADGLCPRCERPTDEGQDRFSDSAPSKAPSALRIIVPVVVVVAVVAGFIALRALRGGDSRTKEVALICESKPSLDPTTCTCIAEKTVVLMSPQDRKAAIDPESPQLRELMLTAAHLCQKEHLVARCVARHQDLAPVCECLMDGALGAFTSTELQEIEAQLDRGSAPPPRYAKLHADCAARSRP